MGFFDDLVVPEPEPDTPRTFELEPLGRHGAAPGGGPPSEYYVPGVVNEVREVGAGEYTRVLLTGWSVWPAEAVLHLGLHLRRFRTERRHSGMRWPEGPGGLRVGLVLADGRRVTTLDGNPWPRPPGAGERVTLRSRGVSGGRFHYRADLHLSALPPEGPLRLVVEWPDRQVPETHTELDGGAVRAASARTVEIWPELRPQDTGNAAGPRPSPRSRRPTEPVPAAKPSGTRPGVKLRIGAVQPTDTPPASYPAGGVVQPVALPGLVAGGRRAPAQEPQDPHRYDPRADWTGVQDWTDLRLVRARLVGGADPLERPGKGAGAFESTPLHRAAERGSPQVVAELLTRVRDVDARDANGCTPLWNAVCHCRAENASLLLEAGAEAWNPLVGEYSPGALALRTSLAPLFADVSGAVPLTEAERTRQSEADRLTAVFDGLHTEGLGAAFVSGVDEEEAIRRLGGDPAATPVLDLDREPGPYGTGPGGFDPGDFDESLRWVGVTGVSGGVVLLQPMGYLPNDARLLERLSAGTTAYGVYRNPKGGTFGTRAHDGSVDRREEIGLSVSADSPEGHWLFRFWQWGDEAPRPNGSLAYACWAAGLWLTDPRPVAGPPRRWLRLPDELV